MTEQAHTSRADFDAARAVRTLIRLCRWRKIAPQVWGAYAWHNRKHPKATPRVISEDSRG
jgi:hypothetical protein